jgi:hypothetical protein
MYLDQVPRLKPCPRSSREAVQVNTILLPVVSWWDVPVFGTPVTCDYFPPDIPITTNFAISSQPPRPKRRHLGTNKQHQQDRETGLPRTYPPSQLLISLARLSSLRRDAFFAHAHPPTPFGAPPKDRPPPHLYSHHSRGHQLRTHGLLTQIPLIDILSSLPQTSDVDLSHFCLPLSPFSFCDSCRAALLLLDLDDTTIILLDTLTRYLPRLPPAARLISQKTLVEVSYHSFRRLGNTRAPSP